MRVTKQARRDAKRLFRLCLADGVLDEERARKVIQQLAGAGRRGPLAVLARFRLLLKVYLAEHTAMVESAALLPVDLRADVRARLAEVYGPGLHTTFTELPALIGGMRVTVGSDVYDGTILGELAALEASFSHA